MTKMRASPALSSGPRKPFIRANGKPNCQEWKTRRRGTSACCWKAWAPVMCLRSGCNHFDSFCVYVLFGEFYTWKHAVCHNPYLNPPRCALIWLICISSSSSSSSLVPAQEKCAVFGLSSGGMSLTSCLISRSSWPGSPTRSKTPTRRRRRWRAPFRGSTTGQLHSSLKEETAFPQHAAFHCICFAFSRLQVWNSGNVKRKGIKGESSLKGYVSQMVPTVFKYRKVKQMFSLDT